MDHAELDVSVKETSVCIVDDTGRIVREVKVPSEPGALLAVLTSIAYHFKRIGLEAGPLSQWLFTGLVEAGLPVGGPLTLSIAGVHEGHIAAQLASQFTPALLALWVTAAYYGGYGYWPIPIPRPRRPIPELATAMGRTTAAAAILQL
jgi:hypothetical protein